MSFIQMDFAGVKEPQAVAPGRYGLTITTAQHRSDKNDLVVSMGIEGHTDAPNVRHFISLPKKEDEADKVYFKKLMLNRFLVQFKIPFDASNGFNLEDFVGAHATAQLTLSEPDDSGNIYNRLQLDKMPAEGTNSAGSRLPPPKS